MNTTINKYEVDLSSPLANGIKIKNNILAFSKSCLSQWYGAYKNQAHKLEIPYLYFNINLTTVNEAIILKHIEFNCAEQAMMYAKATHFKDFETAEKILNEKNPKEQKDLGRLVKNYNDEEWNKRRFDYVSFINKKKFTQNENLKNFLLSTGNLILAERNPPDNDFVWSAGVSFDKEEDFDVSNWKGKNLLGRVLMNIRNNLDNIF